MKTVCIFSSDDIGEIEAVKNVLEDNNIPTIVKNLYTQNLFGGLKPFTGHDPIAGSIQILISEDDLEKGLAILKSDDEELVEQGDVSIRTEEENQAMPIGDDSIAAIKTKRLIYFALLLSALSFLVIPFIINIPLLIKLAKRRKNISIMLGALGAVLTVLGLFLFFSIR